jgi:hypothetical protein
MLEYVAYALVGFATICGLLYVTMSPDVEEARDSNRPDINQ